MFKSLIISLFVIFSVSTAMAVPKNHPQPQQPRNYPQVQRPQVQRPQAQHPQPQYRRPQQSLPVSPKTLPAERPRQSQVDSHHDYPQRHFEPQPRFGPIGPRHYVAPVLERPILADRHIIVPERFHRNPIFIPRYYVSTPICYGVYVQTPVFYSEPVFYTPPIVYYSWPAYFSAGIYAEPVVPVVIEPFFSITID